MANLQTQINDIRKALQDLINNAKKPSSYNLIGEKSDDDVFVIEKESTGEVFKIRYIDIITNLKIDTFVNSNPFTLRKKPTNTGSGIEIGDIIVSGWWDETEFWLQAVYLGGDINTKASWDIINSIEF